MKRIVLTGGGTAGHVTPNMALIPRLLADGWDVHYVGAANSVEQQLIARYPNVTFHAIAWANCAGISTSKISPTPSA